MSNGRVPAQSHKSPSEQEGRPVNFLGRSCFTLLQLKTRTSASRLSIWHLSPALNPLKNDLKQHDVLKKEKKIPGRFLVKGTKKQVAVCVPDFLKKYGLVSGEWQLGKKCWLRGPGGRKRAALCVL